MAQPPVCSIAEDVNLAVEKGLQAAAAMQEARAAAMQVQQEQQQGFWKVFAGKAVSCIATAKSHVVSPFKVRQPQHGQLSQHQAMPQIAHKMQQHTGGTFLEEQRVLSSLEPAGAKLHHAAACRALAKEVAARAWDGAGSKGTEPVPGVCAFRCLAVLSQVRERLSFL